MPLQQVNVGSAPNDRTGDPIRVAFEKINTNALVLDDVMTTVDAVEALVAGEVSRLDGELSATNTTLTGMVADVSSLNALLPAETQARLNDTLTLSQRINDVEGMISSSQLIQTATGAAGVGSWTGAVTSALIPAAAPPGSLSIRVSDLSHEPHYTGNAKDRTFRITGWVRFDTGGSFAILGSTLGNGPGQTTVLAATVAKPASTTWVYLDEDIKVLVDTDDFAVGFDLAGAGIAYFWSLRLSDVSAAVNTLAQVSANYVLKSNGLGSLAEFETYLNTSYFGPTGYLQTDVLIDYATLSYVDGALVAATRSMSAGGSSNPNLINTPKATYNATLNTFGIGNWTKQGATDVTVVNDRPAYASVSDRALRIPSFAYDGPLRRGDIAGKTMRVRGWVKTPNTVTGFTVSLKGHQTTDGIFVNTVTSALQATTNSAWVYIDLRLVSPGGTHTSDWAVGFNFNGTGHIDVFDLDMRDVTDVDAGDSAQLAKYNEIITLSSTLNGTALATKLDSLTAEVTNTTGTTFRAAYTQTAASLASLSAGLSSRALFKVQAGNVVSLLELYAATGNTSQQMSLAKISADQIILEGSVGVEELSVGLGRNEILHPFPKMTGHKGWNAGGPVGFSFSTRGDYGSWGHPTEGVFEVYQSNATQNVWGVFDYKGIIDTGQTIGRGIVVTPGEYLEFSAHISSHRCDVYLELIFLNSSQVEISRAYSNHILNVPGDIWNPRNWVRAQGVAQVPSGAAYAMLRMTKAATTPGQANSYGFFYRPMLARTEAGRVPGPFSSPATTYIGSAGIITSELQATLVTAQRVQAMTASFGTVSALGIQTDGASIQDAAITTAKIANGQITAAKIADANITAAKIQDAAITAAKIGSAAITNAKIGYAEIDKLKLVGNNVVESYKNYLGYAGPVFGTATYGGAEDAYLYSAWVGVPNWGRDTMLFISAICEINYNKTGSLVGTIYAGLEGKHDWADQSTFWLISETSISTGTDNNPRLIFFRIPVCGWLMPSGSGAHFRIRIFSTGAAVDSVELTGAQVHAVCA